MPDGDVEEEEIIQVVNSIESEDEGGGEVKMEEEAADSSYEPPESAVVMMEEKEVTSAAESVPHSLEQHRKCKEPERRIGQVILAVKTWRRLHESKLCNLTQAAQVVGISKKSLDDYYLVLRTGDILGFDYAGNL